jgi:heme/copper-type cytochrome/quinol oxidase subunit 2
MPLTLSQFLFLVLTFAAVVVAVFLVRFLAQLRRAAEEGEKTMAEVRKLVTNLNELDGMIKARLTSLGEFVEASKRTAVNLSEASFFLTTKILRPSSRFWPVVFPLASFFWKHLRKRKEKKHGG